jgi:hypothetical protein
MDSVLVIRHDWKKGQQRKPAERLLPQTLLQLRELQLRPGLGMRVVRTPISED